MSNTAKGPRKAREMSHLEMLQEWCKWKRGKQDPNLPDDDYPFAQTVEAVCSQVGTWKAKYEQVNGERFKEKCAHIATREQLATAQARVKELSEALKVAQKVNNMVRARVALKSEIYDQTYIAKVAMERMIGDEAAGVEALAQPPGGEK